MTQEEFNDVFEIQMKKCSDILTHKKKEYTGDNTDSVHSKWLPPYRIVIQKRLWQV